MRFSTTSALSLFLITVSAQNSSAQDNPQLPDCALRCMPPALLSANCGLTDLACQCGTNQLAIQKNASPCLISACNVADLASASSIGSKICAAYSATATGSPSGATAAAGAPSTTTETPAGATADANANAAGNPASATAATSSSGTATATHSSVSGSPSHTGSKNSTMSHTGSASSPSVTGAAPMMRPGVIGGFMGLFMGVAAVL